LEVGFGVSKKRWIINLLVGHTALSSLHSNSVDSSGGFGAVELSKISRIVDSNTNHKSRI
jgi:hypothetical protein